MEVSGKAVWRGRWWFIIAVVAACWALSFLSILSWLILPLIGFALIHAVRRGAWLPALLLILANPLAVFFIGGLADYAKGTPTLRFMGLPSIDSFNVDQETRCFPYGGGCVVSGNEWVFIDSHNLAVRLASGILGPPSRSYDGPYPTKAEAIQLTSSAPTLDVANFVKGEISVGGEILKMDPAQLEKITQDLFLFISTQDPGAPEIQIQAALLENRCLVLRCQEPEWGTENPDAPDHIILIDRKNMRPFAYYTVRGPSFRYPKVHYLPELSR